MAVNDRIGHAVIVSVVVTMVVVCCELAALWLSLKDERPRKKRRISSLSQVGEEINKTFTNVAIVVNNLAERINTPEPVYMLMNKVTNGVISCPFIPPQAYVAVTEYLAQHERKANLFLSYNDEMKQQWFEMHFTNLGSSSGGR